jgi:hypothetical protein
MLCIPMSISLRESLAPPNHLSALTNGLHNSILMRGKKGEDKKDRSLPSLIIFLDFF